jgi:hypothetical protein
MVKFNARPVILALEKADQAGIKASAAIAIHVNQFIDAVAVSGQVLRDAKGAKAVGSAIREGFADFVAMGAIKQATVNNYATGAARAFFHNVDWTARLFQQPEMAVPSAKTGKTKTSGVVRTTDNAALIKTLRKAIEQARLLKQDTVAQGLVDLGYEIDPEFTETAAE